MKKQPPRKNLPPPAFLPDEPEHNNQVRPDVPYYDPNEETLEAVMSGFASGDVIVKVYKFAGQSREYACYLRNPESLSEESIRELGYGPGRYVLHIVIDGEFRKAITITLAAPLAASAPVQQDSVVKLLLERLAAVENRLINAPQQEREPINSLADAMLKLSQLQGGQQQREVPIETIMKCIELGKTLNGSDDSLGGTIKEIVREAAPAIGQMLAARGQQQQMVNPNPPRQITVEDERAKLEKQLLDGLAFLKKKCIAGADAGLYIDVIIDNRESPDYAYLLHTIVSSDFEAFATRDPEIATPPFEPFFRQIYDGLRSAFTPAHPVAGHSSGPGGNKGNAANNGQAGKGSNGKS